MQEMVFKQGRWIGNRLIRNHDGAIVAHVIPGDSGTYSALGTQYIDRRSAMRAAEVLSFIYTANKPPESTPANDPHMQ